MSFQQGLSGLDAAAKNLDVVGNNVANANTVGFKQARTEFADVFATSLAGSGGTQIGIGTKVSAVTQQFSQGNVTASNNPLDIAISGNGFFRLSDNGSISFTRAGQFQIDKEGFVVNASGQRVTGFTANANGVLDVAAPADLLISTADLTPQATALTDALVNVDSRAGILVPAAFDPTDSTTFNSSTSLSIFDSLGNSHTLSMFFLKSASNTWEVFATNDGVQIGAADVGTLNFLPSGAIDTATTTLPFTLSTAVTTGATSPLVFDLDFTGTTQFGSNFSVNALTQNGFTSGRLSGFSVSADGIILGRYSNGQSTTLGQIVLANFSNPNGLQSLGNNAWSESSESGAPLVGAPATGTLGALQSGAVEDSNIDLTSELVKLITAQRVFQANAQTIKAQDEVLQTLVNLR